MIILAKAKQGEGKTTIVIGLVWYLIRKFSFVMDEVYSNIHLFQPDGSEVIGYHYLTNDEMKAYVTKIVKEHERHKLIIVDEIDRVFPHRWWNEHGQTAALLGLWQDRKMFSIIFGTCHLGKSVDKIIRDALTYLIVCKIVKSIDAVKMVVVNMVDKEIFRKQMNHTRFIQSMFDSWELSV